MVGRIEKKVKSVAIFMRGNEHGSKWLHLGEIKAPSKEEAIASFFRVKLDAIKKIMIENSNVAYVVPFKPNSQVAASIL